MCETLATPCVDRFYQKLAWQQLSDLILLVFFTLCFFFYIIACTILVSKALKKPQASEEEEGKLDSFVNVKEENKL